MSDRKSSEFKGDTVKHSVSELPARDSEKADSVVLPTAAEEVNVGLTEFEEAKEAGVHVTKAEGRRYIYPLPCRSHDADKCNTLESHSESTSSSSRWYGDVF